MLKNTLQPVTLVVCAVVLATACGDGEGPTPPAPLPPPSEVITLPPGFEINIYARNLVRPRSLALGDSGTVFVGTYWFTKGLTSPIYAVRDTDGDHVVDLVKEIHNDFNTPNGIDFHDGALYVVDEDRVFRIDSAEIKVLNTPEFAPVVPDPNPVLLFDGLPSRVETDSATHLGHWWRYLRYGPDDKLYITVGTRWSFEVGAHTAQDLDDDERYSTVVRVDPAGGGFEVFATGVRNSMGLTFHPDTDELWFTDNGASWPFTDSRFYDIPPDELNAVPTQGMNFGFPYVHGRLADPLIGDQAPADLSAPRFEFEGHTAPLGLRFYTGNMFPAEYRNALFIAEHGTEASTPATRAQVSGDRISVIRLDASGEPISYEVFADGFLPPGVTNAGYTRRPVDLLVMPDGALLISDDQAGVIYRISYQP